MRHGGLRSMILPHGTRAARGNTYYFNQCRARRSRRRAGADTTAPAWAIGDKKHFLSINAAAIDGEWRLLDQMARCQPKLLSGDDDNIADDASACEPRMLISAPPHSR